MVRVCARPRLNGEFVCEICFWSCWALVHAISAIHLVGSVLIYAMLMKGGAVLGLVVDVNLNSAALVTPDERTRKPIIDQRHRSIHTAWIVCPVSNGPVVDMGYWGGFKVPT
jgi:hypothetical protein